mgnify:FL=1
MMPLRLEQIEKAMGAFLRIDGEIRFSRSGNEYTCGLRVRHGGFDLDVVAGGVTPAIALDAAMMKWPRNALEMLAKELGEAA